MNRPARNNKEDENLGSFYIGRMRPPATPPKRVLPRGALTIVVLLSFAAIIWFAYPTGQEKYEGIDIPIITADKSSYKFKPDDPGGMEVRHQDSTVFDPLEKKTAEVEHLLPTPEQPVDKDAVLKKEGIELKPALKLDTQMEEIGEGTEKVVVTEEAKPAAKPSPVKKEAAKPAPEPKAAATPGNFSIQLGSYREVSGAKTDWGKLQKKHPQLMKGLTMRTIRVDLGRKGVWYRLYAGTMSETRAREICASLKSENTGGCIVAKI